MKKILFIILISLILSPSRIIFAQEDTTPTPSPASNQIPGSEEEIEQIQRIKDIVASKVAELNLVEKRGLLGTLDEVSNTEVSITDRYGEKRKIDVDELTKFDFDDEDFGITDLEKGKQYSFVGLFNKDTDRLLARFISSPESIPVYAEGAISNLNEDEFQITVLDLNGKETVVDIERSTDTMSIDGEGQITESGFSNLVLGERVIVTGFMTKDNTLSATRVSHFINTPPAPELQAKLRNKDDTTVATGSGNTLEIMETEVGE